MKIYKSIIRIIIDTFINIYNDKLLAGQFIYSIVNISLGVSIK